MAAQGAAGGGGGCGGGGSGEEQWNSISPCLYTHGAAARVAARPPNLHKLRDRDFENPALPVRARIAPGPNNSDKRPCRQPLQVTRRRSRVCAKPSTNTRQDTQSDASCSHVPSRPRPMPAGGAPGHLATGMVWCLSALAGSATLAPTPPTHHPKYCCSSGMSSRPASCPIYSICVHADFSCHLLAFRAREHHLQTVIQRL